MLLISSIFFRILAAVKSARVMGSVEQYPSEMDPSSASVIPDMLENIVKLVNSNFYSRLIWNSQIDIISLGDYSYN